jgi:hypothetical protein
MNIPRSAERHIRILFDRYRSVIGKGIWVVAGQAVTVAFTLAGTRLITQYLDPALYGTVNLAQNGILLFSGSRARQLPHVL